MPAAVMSYTTLLDDIENYCERHDTEFLAQRDRFIMLAESRIATEAKFLGYQRSVTANFVVGNAVVNKPTRWHDTVSIHYYNGTTRVFLRARSYEYCRAYWPVEATTGAPRYYADYDYDYWLVVGTPDDTYDYEVVYHEKPEPLSATNETNWLTEFQPQLLLFACLLEAIPFVKNYEVTKTWQDAYDRELAAINVEDKERKSDRSTKRSS